MSSCTCAVLVYAVAIAVTAIAAHSILSFLYAHLAEMQILHQHMHIFGSHLLQGLAAGAGLLGMHFMCEVIVCTAVVHGI